MGMQLYAIGIDWKRFRARVPPGEGGRRVPLTREITRDVSRANSDWAQIYPALKRHPGAKGRKGLGLLTAATSMDMVDGVTFDKYYETRSGEAAEFEEEDESVACPDLSPAQVNRVLTAVRALPREDFVAEVRRAWAAAFGDPARVPLHLSTVDKYLAYLDEWMAVLEEVEGLGAGLAIRGG